MLKNMKFSVEIGGGYVIVLVWAALAGDVSCNGMNSITDRPGGLVCLV